MKRAQLGGESQFRFLVYLQGFTDLYGLHTDLLCTTLYYLSNAVSSFLTLGIL